MNKRLALLLLAWSVPALAQFSFDYEFENNTKPWQEIQAKLPSAPKAENLVQLDLGPATENQYFVDRASVSLGTDNVVRYTMVIRTEGGAENVSYEGMRCGTVEQKIYAFGRPNGEWARNKYASWSAIHLRQARDYRRELFQHYFCSLDGPADMDRIRQALAHGGFNRGDE